MRVERMAIIGEGGCKARYDGQGKMTYGQWKVREFHFWLRVGTLFKIHFNTSITGTNLRILSTSKATVIIWASMRQNLSSGFPAKQHSNQFTQLQRLAKKLKFGS